MPKVLIPHAEIEARVAILAEKISRDYGGKEPVLIGVLKGVIFFFADLVMKMTIPTKLDFVRASSYGSGSTSSGVIRILKDVELPLKGEDVILVEDIVDTGLTLDQMIRHLEVKEPASIKICALIDKSERRTKEVRIDYLGFEVPRGFLIGYGFILSIFNGLWTVSVSLNGAAVATVLVYSSAAFTALLGWRLFHEPLGPIKILAVIFSLAGLAFGLFLYLYYQNPGIDSTDLFVIKRSIWLHAT